MSELGSLPLPVGQLRPPQHPGHPGRPEPERASGSNSASFPAGPAPGVTQHEGHSCAVCHSAKVDSHQRTAVNGGEGLW